MRDQGSGKTGGGELGGDEPDGKAQFRQRSGGDGTDGGQQDAGETSAIVVAEQSGEMAGGGRTGKQNRIRANGGGRRWKQFAGAGFGAGGGNGAIGGDDVHLGAAGDQRCGNYVAGRSCAGEQDAPTS